MRWTRRDCPTGTSCERFSALVRAAAAQRGRVPVPTDPAHDDLADPYHAPLASFEVCARLVDEALQAPLDLLAGRTSPVRP